MKEMIERSREFRRPQENEGQSPLLLCKAKGGNENQGNAAYEGKFGTLEEACNSDKVICLIPSNDGRIYELRKMEQGEFIAPKRMWWISLRSEPGFPWLCRKSPLS